MKKLRLIVTIVAFLGAVILLAQEMKRDSVSQTSKTFNFTYEATSRRIEPSTFGVDGSNFIFIVHYYGAKGEISTDHVLLNKADAQQWLKAEDSTAELESIVTAKLK